LKAISRSEWQIARAKRAIKSRRASLSCRGLTKDEAAAIKGRIDSLRALIDRHVKRIGLCRDIGDAIAFLYIDRWDIKPLAMKEPPGNITGKRGSRLERGILRAIFRDGHRGVLNDLTGSLRYGDITIFRPFGTFVLIEAKSGNGGNKERAARQEASANAVLNYLHTDEGELFGRPVTRRAASERMRYHVRAINRMIAEMATDGATEVMRQVEPGVFYMLLRDGYSNRVFERIFSARVEGPLLTMWANDFKRRGEAYYPFPLAIDDPRACLAFYAGIFSIGVFIDIQKVARLSGTGLKIEWSSDQGSPMRARVPETFGHDTPEYVDVGLHLINRMAAEFMSPRSFIKLVADRASLIANDQSVD